MASLKKLAGQTAWYGVSSIFSRFLNYLLTPLLTKYLSMVNYGEMSLIYAAIPFMNVVFTYGMETTFFRFSNEGNNQKHVFNIGSLSLFFTTIIFTSSLIFWKVPIAHLLRIDEHPEFIIWIACFIALDTLTTLPFAKLRNENRPRKYATIKIANILVNIGLNVFFYMILPGLAKQHPGSFVATWYNPQIGAGYVLIANLIASAITFLLLIPEFLSLSFEWDIHLWKRMLIYSYPLILVGLGGVINETFDRIMLGWFSSAPTEKAKITEVGIYGACYKLSLLISLFVQAFRLGAEPFFFQQARNEGADAPKTYARVMKFFVITICTMFLAVMLYLDIWKHFIANHHMWVGLKVVPILLVANMCLGVYYNLAIWYKLSNRTRAGATITIIGALVTLSINYIFIPRYSYMACAWATLSCYASMMIISYLWGRKAYPVPYPVKKIASYFGTMLLVFFLYRGLISFVPKVWEHLLIGTVFILGYVAFIIRIEGRELKGIPIINRFIK